MLKKIFTYVTLFSVLFTFHVHSQQVTIVASEDNIEEKIDEIELKDSKLALPLSSLYELNSEGTFFGSDFSELGFLFSLDDTKSGSIEMKGAITAQQQ